MKDIPLSADPGTSLRVDCVADDGTAVDWATTVGLFYSWQERARNADSLVQNWPTDSIQPFSDEGQDRQLTRLKQLRERFREEHHTTWAYILTFSANPLSEGHYASPVDFYSDLMQSWEKVRNVVYKATSDTEYCFVRTLSPSENAYPVHRLCLLTADEIEVSTLESALQTHVDNSPVAQSDYHAPELALRYGRSLNIDELIDENLRGFRDDPDDTTRAFDSLLWSACIPRFQFSRSADDYIDAEPTVYEPELTEVQ